MVVEMLKVEIIIVNRWGWWWVVETRSKYPLICRIQHLRLCGCKRLMLKAVSMQIEMCFKLPILLPMCRKIRKL